MARVAPADAHNGPQPSTGTADQVQVTGGLGTQVVAEVEHPLQGVDMGVEDGRGGHGQIMRTRIVP